MRIVTRDMVVVEGGEFQAGASGYFMVHAICPTCREKRLVNVPISEPGKQHSQQANCNKGHRWTVRASVVR